MDIHYAKDHFSFFARYRTPDPHSHFAKHLIFGLDGELDCMVEDASFRCRGLCIGSQVRHTVVTPRSKMFVLLAEETGSLAASLDRLYLQGRSSRILDAAVMDKLDTAGGCQSDLAAIDSAVIALCGGASAPAAAYDERIARVLTAIERAEGIEKNLPGDLTRVACLSRSRLSHLFHEQVGISLAGYLMMAKLEKTFRYVLQGENLTTASVHAGFDSPSHFAATCRKNFGIAFSDFRLNR